MKSVPIFRAKKIDSDEYIIGYLKFDRKHNHYSINPIDDENTWHKIEENTLAIHFTDMLDSQGNKIFASLQEDGKGGDILQSRGYKSPCIFNKGFTVRTVFGVCNFYMLADRLKVIGIQE